MENENNTDRADYDISIIRPEVRHDDIKLRGEGMEPARLKQIRKGLRTLHAFEIMAVNIYKFAISKEKTDVNRELTAAMLNEMTHVQDFQTRLYEYGFTPSPTKWVFWIAGLKIGLLARMCGTKMTLKIGVWVEAKACDHYKHLLESIDWDDDTRRMAEKDQADEFGHINRWKSLLAS